jgi:hypothetical protein
MKIAVCLSGGIKHPQKSLESIKSIFPNEFVKVFIHTWSIGKEEIYQNTNFGHTNPSGQYYVKHTNDNFSILNEYNYEKLLIENYDEKNNLFERLFSEIEFPRYERRDVGTISMWYSICRSNQLKIEYERENNIIFDKVIRVRFDSDFEGKTLFVNKLSGDISIPLGRDWNNKMNDQFAIGNSDIMNYYSSLYLHLKSLGNTQYHSESLLYQHLKNKNIDVERFEFNININNKLGPQLAF